MVRYYTTEILNRHLPNVYSQRAAKLSQGLKLFLLTTNIDKNFVKSNVTIQLYKFVTNSKYVRYNGAQKTIGIVEYVYSPKVKLKPFRIVKI